MFKYRSFSPLFLPFFSPRSYLFTEITKNQLHQVISQLLDRYLAAARECKIPAVIVFNKMDLMPSTLPEVVGLQQGGSVAEMLERQIQSFTPNEPPVENEGDDNHHNSSITANDHEEGEDQAEESEEEEDLEAVLARSRARKLAREARRAVKGAERCEVKFPEKEISSAEEEGMTSYDEEDWVSDDEGRFDHYDISEDEWLEMEKTLAEYHKLNYAIFRISSKTGAGTADLQKLFDCRSPTLLVGQTGSGKSALLNMLCPDLEINTRTLSDHEVGRHTTSSIEEHILPSGLCLNIESKLLYV